MRALILAGGPLEITSRLAHLLGGADIVVAADGGLRHAKRLELRPDLVIGDLDSVDAQDLEAWPDVAVERHRPDKDQLDLELALNAALDRGATTLQVVGAFGGRLDQTLAAVLIAGRFADRGCRIALLDGHHEAYALATGDELALHLPRGTTFSLLALSDVVRVDVHGAAYPLRDALLERGVGLGVSNRARGDVQVRVRRGCVAVLVDWLV